MVMTILKNTVMLLRITQSIQQSYCAHYTMEMNRKQYSWSNPCVCVCVPRQFLFTQCNPSQKVGQPCHTDFQERERNIDNSGKKLKYCFFKVLSIAMLGSQHKWHLPCKWHNLILTHTVTATVVIVRLLSSVFCDNFTVGEDGQVKIWSKSGMLRSTLAQQGKFIFLKFNYSFEFGLYKINVSNRP